MYRPSLNRRWSGRAPTQTSGADMLEKVHDLVGRYLAAELSADELQVRLPDGWELDGSEDRDARRLVLLIMGNLAEFSNGDLSEPQLRERLGILTPSVRTYWWGQMVTRSGSATSQPEGTAVQAGRSREVAPA